MSATVPGSTWRAQNDRARNDGVATIADDLAAVTAGSRPVTFSFELYPPRGPEENDRLWRTVRRLESLRPDFVSVTYGANGSTRDRTIRATEEIARQTSLRTMAHLTCVGQPVDELRRVIGRYADAGVRHVLAVRGDMPGGPLAPWQRHPDGLDNATELVRLVASLGDFCIGVAAFPDLHPERRDADLDARLLVAKQEAGASFAITQMCFDANRYFALVERVRALGSDLPIIPGIQPVTSFGQVRRFAELSGQRLPDDVVARLTAVADDPKAVRRVGVEIGTEVAERLLAGGAPGLHFFTLNGSTATRRIRARIADPARRHATPGDHRPDRS